MLKQSFESIQRAIKSEIDTVGEFSLGDVVTPTPVVQAIAPKTINGVRVPTGYLRTFGEYRPKDIGNAERFFDLYSDKFKYTSHLGWLVYQNGLWSETKNSEEREAVKETFKEMGYALTAEEAYINKSADDYEYQVKALHKMRQHYEESCGEGRLGACLRVAASDPAFVVAPEALDAQDFKLNTHNGVIDLLTGEVEPHAPGLLMTKSAGTSIAEPGTDCPNWKKFLYEVMDNGDAKETAEMVEWFQVVFAYCLSGDTKYEAVFQLWGAEGGNGKSTLLSVMEKLWGTYQQTVDFNTFKARPDADNYIPNDIAALEGARLVTIDETPKGAQFNTKLLKKFVSGTTGITARFLNKEFFTYKSKAKLMIATNHRIVVREDNAVWRRMYMVSFNNTFTKEKGNLDIGLNARLDAELPAILRWAVEGIAKLKEKGLYMPSRVQRDTAEYKDSQDDFAGFFTEHCEIDASYKISTSSAYKLYVVWAEDQRIKNPMTKGSFKREILNKGYKEKHTKDGDFFLGLRRKEIALSI